MKTEPTLQDSYYGLIVERAEMLKVIVNILDITDDGRIDRLLEIRSMAAKAVEKYGQRRDPLASSGRSGLKMNLDADPSIDPNFGDYNIPPGGEHP